MCSLSQISLWTAPPFLPPPRCNFPLHPQTARRGMLLKALLPVV